MREIKYKIDMWDPDKCMYITATYGLCELVSSFGMKNFRQYTGLEDKNGKEIYEGDIIELTFSSGKKRNQIVEMEESCGCCSTIIGWDKELKEGAVVGNIYENSELIDG